MLSNFEICLIIQIIQHYKSEFSEMFELSCIEQNKMRILTKNEINEVNKNNIDTACDVPFC